MFDRVLAATVPFAAATLPKEDSMAPSHALTFVTAQVSMGSPPRGDGAPAFPWSLVVVALLVGVAVALAARAFRSRATPPPMRRHTRDGYPFRGPHDAHTKGGDR